VSVHLSDIRESSQRIFHSVFDRMKGESSAIPRIALARLLLRLTAPKPESIGAV
jgi:hypothetical protein